MIVQFVMILFRSEWSWWNFQFWLFVFWCVFQWWVFLKFLSFESCTCFDLVQWWCQKLILTHKCIWWWLIENLTEGSENFLVTLNEISHKVIFLNVECSCLRTGKKSFWDSISSVIFTVKVWAMMPITFFSKFAMLSLICKRMIIFFSSMGLWTKIQILAPIFQSSQNIIWAPILTLSEGIILEKMWFPSKVLPIVCINTLWSFCWLFMVGFWVRTPSSFIVI